MSNDYGNILCPACHGEYLHHCRIEVFVREEDADTGTHVVISHGDVISEEYSAAVVTVDSDMSANPSSRRQGIKIHFWCELCDAKPVLSIIQHKGITFMDMDG